VTAASPRRRLLVLLSLLAVPWSVQAFTAADVTLLFPWGLVNTNPPAATTLYRYLFVYTAGLPDFLLAWPLSVGLYALAVGSAAGGALLGREDPRVTAGLLLLAGLAHLSLARGFSVQPGRVAWPLGTAVCAFVAWWFYWPLVRRR
jgi:uncharacterized protein (TIGR04206 family)